MAANTWEFTKYTGFAGIKFESGPEDSINTATVDSITPDASDSIFWINRGATSKKYLASSNYIINGAAAITGSASAIVAKLRSDVFPSAAATASTTADAALVLASSPRAGVNYSTQIGALQDADTAIHAQIDAPTKSKSVLHLGTSMSTYNWPEIGAAKVGANITNISLGSSMVRAAQKDGSYGGLPYTLLLRSLSHTIGEKNTIIGNWATIRPTLAANPVAPTDLNTLDGGSGLTYAQTALSASWENRLKPYLDGTLAAPDYITIEHGYNDYQAAVTGNVNDTTSDFTTIPGTRNNRNYFLGAMNYIIDIILSYKPRMIIGFFGHFEKQYQPNIATAQEALAAYWLYALSKPYDVLGMSSQLVGATTMRNIWLTAIDGTHPTDPVLQQRIGNLYFQLLNRLT